MIARKRIARLLVLAVAALCVAACSSGPPNRETTIVFLGDSLTGGHMLGPEIAYPTVIQAYCKERGWNCRVINAGISGDTTEGGLRRLSSLLDMKIDVLVVALGVNDMFRNVAPSDARANLQRIIDRTRAAYPDVHVVVAGVEVPWIWRLEDPGFYPMYKELAKENRATYIPSLLKGVAGSARLNTDDMVHPNAEGHRVMADTVWKYLEPVLKKIK